MMVRTAYQTFLDVFEEIRLPFEWAERSPQARSVWTAMIAHCMSAIPGVGVDFTAEKVAYFTGVPPASVRKILKELELSPNERLRIDWQAQVFFMDTILMNWAPQSIDCFRGWSAVWPKVRASRLHDDVVNTVTYFLEHDPDGLMTSFRAVVCQDLCTVDCSKPQVRS